MKFTTAFVALFAAAVVSESTEAVTVAPAVEGAARAEFSQGPIEMQSVPVSAARARKEAKAQAKLAKKYELILASHDNLRH